MAAFFVGVSTPFLVPIYIAPQVSDRHATSCPLSALCARPVR